MSSEIFYDTFKVLYEDLDTPDPETIPLLAHYTSYPVLESILKKEELWLSNPLYMNDLQEVRFGINESYRAVLESDAIRDAFRSWEDHQSFLRHLEVAYSKFANEHVLDVYVFCLSAHDDEKDADGRLSMWRGYGSNASGACIVFDPKKIPQVDETPFTFSRVAYLSHDQHVGWIANVVAKLSDAIRGVNHYENVTYHAAYYLFERIKLFALFTKHRGFYEEQEWRLVYSPEKDENSKFTRYIDYHLGPRGPEPKLKLRLKEFPSFPIETLSLQNIVHKIILGPTNSHPLGKAMFHKILQAHRQDALKDRVFGSTIPFRGPTA